MTRATLQSLMLSPSRAAGKVCRSTPLPLEADLMLPTIAHECGHENVSDFMREAAQFYAQAKKAAHATALKAAMHAPVIAVGIVGIWLSFVDSDSRRARTVVGVRIVRSARRTDLEEVLL